MSDGAHGTEESARELLIRCEDRLMARIRWMMGAGARRIAETADFHGELVRKVLAEADTLSWRDETHFLRLATRIARNLIVQETRRRRAARFDSLTTTMMKAVALDPEGRAPDSVVAEEERVDRLIRELEALPGDYRRVIELRHFDDLPFRDIGIEMGREPNAVQLLHSRALKQLGQRLR